MATSPGVDFYPDFPSREAWDDFIASRAGPDGGLLQSWAWGEAQRRAGRPVRRVALVAHHLLAAWQVIELPLPLGQRYWYVPRPVSCQLSDVNGQSFLHQVNAWAEKARVVFLRVDGGAGGVWESWGFRPVAGTVQPQEELIIAVDRPAEELLAAMKPKTRYNIGLAQRRGVTVAERPLHDEGQRQTFIAMVAATAKRHGIRPHPEAYYQALLAGLAHAGAGRLLVAEHGGAPLAAALLVSCHGVLTYLHGGSSDSHGELMAPHLLQWQAILLARQLHCARYNFGGVSLTNPAWAGLTRFKQGFAPATPFTRYGRLRELPFKPIRYRLIQAIKTIQTIRKPYVIG